MIFFKIHFIVCLSIFNVNRADFETLLRERLEIMKKETNFINGLDILFKKKCRKILNFLQLKKEDLSRWHKTHIYKGVKPIDLYDF